MSNRPKRRVINVKRLFPTKTPITAYEMFSAIMMRAKHRAEYRELGDRMGEVDCTCGFVMPAPFGEPQAAVIIEEHYARFHVIPDPMGAKYRD